MKAVNEKNLKTLVSYLLYKEYLSEFKIIDGLNQHKDGLNFQEWVDKIFEIFNIFNMYKG